MLYDYKCIITRIVDGDTIDCNIDLGFDIWLYDQRIRLAKIDAPETRTRDELEERMGELAEDYVAEQLPVGTETILHSLIYKPRDIYGRILGDFLVPDTNLMISDLLLENRYAVKYRPDDKERMIQEHLENWKYWNNKL